MAGYAEVGGNGSVQWEVDSDDTTPGSQPGSVQRPNPNGYRHRGKDITTGPPQRPGDQFTVRVKVPSGGVNLTMNGNQLVLRLPIEANNTNQIRVEW